MDSAASDNGRVNRIDDLLPQAQCRQCGFDACLPYAAALARTAAPINRCPPGGDETIAALAELLQVPVVPLNARLGEHRPPSVALIDEQVCIGCTLCIQACPVDAIIGAAKLMHSVLSGECTGCDLCLPPCPVDCIEMVAAPALDRAQQREKALLARRRYRARETRLASAANAGSVVGEDASVAGELHEAGDKSPLVLEAMARARNIRRAMDSPESGP